MERLGRAVLVGAREGSSFSLTVALIGLGQRVVQLALRAFDGHDAVGRDVDLDLVRDFDALVADTRHGMVPGKNA